MENTWHSFLHECPFSCFVFLYFDFFFLFFYMNVDCRVPIVSKYMFYIASSSAGHEHTLVLVSHWN